MVEYLLVFDEENKEFFEKIKEEFPEVENSGSEIKVDDRLTKNLVEFIEAHWHEYSKKRIKYELRVLNGSGEGLLAHKKSDVATIITFLEKK